MLGAGLDAVVHADPAPLGDLIAGDDVEDAVEAGSLEGLDQHPQPLALDVVADEEEADRAIAAAGACVCGLRPPLGIDSGMKCHHWCG